MRESLENLPKGYYGLDGGEKPGNSEDQLGTFNETNASSG